MIPKPLHEIVEADLVVLVSQSAEEGRQLDFKRDLPRDDRDGSKALCNDVCAMANASGGDIVFGIEEKDGVAGAIVPQTLPLSEDAYVLKLTSVIRDRIEPLLHGVHIHPVPLANGGSALVIRVPRSFSGLHRLKVDGAFYVRGSRSNIPLDVPAIVNRVAEQLGREDRLKAFFARRYADLLADEHPLPVAHGPKLVLHAFPVRDFLNGDEVDLEALPRVSEVPFLSDSGGHSPRNTFDGKAFFDADENVASYFTLFMRSGVVEACTELVGSHWPEEHKKVDLNYAERCVLHFLRAFEANGFVNATTGYPFVIKVALLGANGWPFTSGTTADMRHAPNGLPVRQPLPALTLPDVLIEAKGMDIVHEMYPAFLRMWHAWAYPKSFTYTNKAGKWTRQMR